MSIWITVIGLVTAILALLAEVLQLIRQIGGNKPKEEARQVGDNPDTEKPREPKPGAQA